MTRKVLVQPFESASMRFTSPNMDFSTGLKPLTSWMHLIGIPLGVKDVRPKRWRLWLSFYSIAIFNFNLANHFASLSLFFHEDQTTPVDNKVLTWNSAIAASTFSSNIIGHNVTSLAFKVVRWEHLVAVLNRLHKACIFQEADYRRFNKKCSLGLAIIILVHININF